jgi:hypothetical protein
MRTKDISALVMRLYAQVFKFFGLILQYFSSKTTRLLDAFNEKSFEMKFGAYVTDIKGITDMIRRRAELGSRAELRDLNLSIRYMFSKIDTKVEEIKQVQERTKEMQQNCINLMSAALCNVGSSGQRLLLQSPLLDGHLLQAWTNNWSGGYDHSQAHPSILFLKSPTLGCLANIVMTGLSVFSSSAAEAEIVENMTSQAKERPASLVGESSP